MAFFDPFFNIAREQADEFGVDFFYVISLGPFKNKRVRVIVDNTTVTAAELTTMELVIVGRVESKYGIRGAHSDRRHRIGGKYAPFTIRRWFKFGEGQKIFYDLHQNNTTFEIDQFVTTQAKDDDLKGIRLTGCKSYRYRLITGTPNDIIAEEIAGYATGWEQILDTWDEFCMLFLVNESSSQLLMDGNLYNSGETFCTSESGIERSIEAVLAPDYVFDYWETSENIEIGDMYSSSTWIKINGRGTLTLHVHYGGC